MTKEKMLAEKLDRSVEWVEMYKGNKSYITPNDVFSLMDIYAKQVSIDFFKWYGVRMAGFLHYILDIRATVTSNEIEEKIKEHEGKPIEELFNLYLHSTDIGGSQSKQKT